MSNAFRCFRRENFALVTPTALAVADDRFFLATHLPARLGRLDRDYNRLPDDPAHPVTEQDLVTALRDADARRVTFALVRGSTGAGKSHLIRWVHARLGAEPLPDTAMLLVRRDETNLREVIRKVVGLAGAEPGKVLAEVYEKVGKVGEELSDAGKRNLLLGELAFTLDPGNYPEGAFDPLAGATPGPELNARRTAVRELPGFFRDEVYRTHLASSGMVIDELVRLTIGRRTGDQTRDRPRQFTADDFDLPDRLVYTPPEPGPGPKAKAFASFLKRDPRLRQQAAAYVNSRLKPATDRLLNLEGVSLVDVFNEVRRRLRAARRRLILLIEDIADVEYMHRQVLEALITDPADDLCPLASAVGVSDGFSHEIPTAVRDRAGSLLFTLDVDRGPADEYQQAFAARYLNALRTPLSQLDARPDRPPASACRGCQYNRSDECHSAFGAVGRGEDAVGLFPLSPRAVGLIAQKALVEVKGQTDRVFNPRLFLAQALRPAILEEADTFDAGRYPPKHLRKHFLGDDGQQGVADTLARQFGRDRGWQAEALHAIWGTSLPAEVYKVFCLTPPNTPTVPPAGGGSGVVTPPVEPIPPVVPPPPPAGPPPTSPDTSRLAVALRELDQYHTGSDKVGENSMTLIRAVVRSAVLSRIEWNRLFLHKGDWEAPTDFPAETVNLEADGMRLQPGGAKAQRLEIRRKYDGREDWMPAIGLQGLLLAHHHGGWNFEHATQSGAYYLRHATPLVDLLAQQATSHLLGEFAPPKSDPPAAGLELLALAARVAADLQPNADEAATVRALFERRERDFATVPGDANAAWAKLLTEFGSKFAAVREKVLWAYNCAKGKGSSFILDAARVLAATDRWAERRGVPKEVVPKTAYWRPVAELRKVVDQHLALAVRAEAMVWGEWASDVETVLGGGELGELIDCGEGFRRAAGLGFFRCELPDAELEALGRRSPFLARLRKPDRSPHRVRQSDLEALATKLRASAEAPPTSPGDPVLASPFAAAFAAAEAVRKEWAASPDALDRLVPLLAMCRRNADWRAARDAWWDYTLTLAEAAGQTSKQKVPESANLAAARKRVGDLLTALKAEADAIQGATR